MNLEQLHQLFLAHPTICTDTRKISKNCLFFALKGPNFNGNEFADRALENGAAYALVDEEKFNTSEKHILVEDVLTTLQKLSTYHRKQSKAKVVSLTGSNGKTTTKELIHSVLSQSYNTIATLGNLNNHIGVPLTLLSITDETEIAIVEMGANHQKEIDFLCGIAQPDYGYITNFGKAHLEGFGGIEGVIKGKSELYDHLIENNKHIFMNADDPIQLEKLGSYVKKIGYSTENPQYFNINYVDADPFVQFTFEGLKVKTQLIGKYNFTNCCAAVVIGKYFNVPTAKIKAALESYQPKNNRSQIIEKNGLEIILDAYNANPSSMKVALENLKGMQSDFKTLILGDMFELGEDAKTEHQGIVDLATSLGFSNVFLVGENFSRTQTDFHQFDSYDSFESYLKGNVPRKGTVLIKGSRGMALERTLDLF